MSIIRTLNFLGPNAIQLFKRVLIHPRNKDTSLIRTRTFRWSQSIIILNCTLQNIRLHINNYKPNSLVDFVIYCNSDYIQ